MDKIHWSKPGTDQTCKYSNSKKRVLGPNISTGIDSYTALSSLRFKHLVNYRCLTPHVAWMVLDVMQLHVLSCDVCWPLEVEISRMYSHEVTEVGMFPPHISRRICHHPSWPRQWWALDVAKVWAVRNQVQPNYKPGFSAKLLSKLHQIYIFHEDTMVAIPPPNGNYREIVGKPCPKSSRWWINQVSKTRILWPILSLASSLRRDWSLNQVMKRAFL